jgi:hypothetical protein
MDLPVQMLPSAVNSLFGNEKITVDVLLRGKHISRYNRSIRIVPVFDTTQAHDVVLVTCDHVRLYEEGGGGIHSVGDVYVR